jgi:hypothetical protein
MNNRNHFEYVGKIFNLKERQTQKGWMYTLGIPVNGQSKDGEHEYTEWLSGVIFTKERVTLQDRGEAHFIAVLEVKPPYGDRPASIGFTGFNIEPVFGNVYRVAKKKQPKPQPEPVEDSEGVPF